MKNIPRYDSRSNSTPIQSNHENQNGSQVYEVKKNRTQSKSIRSKLKNLGYTLSRPFRSLMKEHIEKSIGTRHSGIATKDIKGPVTSIRTTPSDLARSPKTSENNYPPPNQVNYEITGGKGGYISPTFSEKFLSPKLFDANR